MRCAGERSHGCDRRARSRHRNVDGEVGEILIQGPSVTQGYWNRAEESEQVFGATVPGREGKFLRTGDLGFFRDGELFVTGRVKDVIIIRGRNHYPQDIEQSAEEAHPAVLPGAAFALADDSGERLVVVHQLDRQFRGADFTKSFRRSAGRSSNSTISIRTLSC